MSKIRSVLEWEHTLPWKLAAHLKKDNIFIYQSDVGDATIATKTVTEIECSMENMWGFWKSYEAPKTVDVFQKSEFNLKIDNIEYGTVVLMQ
jgi:hypothetical protein